MKKLGNLMAPTGKYTNRDGEEKTSWLRCGALFEDSGKFKIKLDGVPVGASFEGWLQVFPDKPSHQVAGDSAARQQARGAAGLPPQGPPDDYSDIPM